MKDRTKRPLILQGRTILLETKAKQTEKARAFISSIADLKESPETLHTYLITDLSLWNAACAGVDIEKIIYNLDLYSKYPIPKELEEYIRSMLSRYGLVKLHPHPKSTLFNSNQSTPAQIENSILENKDEISLDSTSSIETIGDVIVEEPTKEVCIQESSISEISLIENAGPKKVRRRRIVKKKGEHLKAVEKTQNSSSKVGSRRNHKGRSSRGSILGSDLIEITKTFPTFIRKMKRLNFLRFLMMMN